MSTDKNVKDIDKVKICKVCGIEKPITKFLITKKLDNGTRIRKTTCRSCSRHSKDNINKEYKQQLLASFGFKCYYCGKYGDTVDHIIPKSKGGSNYYKNLVCACKECNSRRGNMSVKKFKKLLDKEKLINEKQISSQPL